MNQLMTPSQGMPMPPPRGAGGPTPQQAMGAPQQPQQPPPTRDEIMEALHNTSYLVAGLKELFEKDGGASKSDVIKEAGHLISEGMMAPQQAAQELSSLPDGSAQIKGWLQNHIANANASIQKLTMMLYNSGQPQGQQPQAAPQQMPARPQVPPNMLMGSGGASSG